MCSMFVQNLNIFHPKTMGHFPVAFIIQVERTVPNLLNITEYSLLCNSTLFGNCMSMCNIEIRTLLC